MSPIDARFNERNWIAMFSNTANTALRSQSDETARRIITLLSGAPPPGDTTPPDVPTNLEAVAGVESVSLSWTASLALDTNRYRVQRSTTSGSGFTTITETLDTAVLDGGLTGGTEYFYQVAAIDDSDNVSAYTAEVFATPSTSGGSGTPPEPPINVLAVSYDGRVLIRWNPGDTESVRYDVHRDNNTGGPYTTIATGIVGAPPSIAYLDTDVVNGSTYYYVITAFNANGDESANSLEVIGAPVAATNANPHPVSITALTQGYLSVKIAWTPNTDTDFALYRIKYGTGTGVYTEEIEVTDQSTQSYQVTGLDAATTYYFVVEVEDTAGNLSAESAEDSEASFDQTNPDPGSNTAPANVTGFSIVEEGDGFVRVQWTPSTETDAAAYILFRNNGNNGTAFAAVGSRQHPLNTFQYTGLVNDTTYAFRILCQDTAGLTSGFTTTYGTPSANSGTVIPPGGGTGSGGQFSGDTGLGPVHKAPGATFDVVINCSTGGFVTSTGMWGLIRSAILQFALGQPPGFTWANKRVAILLPEREFNTRALNNWGGVSINANTAGFGIDITFPIAAGVQWHFIAPWPTASLSDTSAQAKAADKKFQLVSRGMPGSTFAGQAYAGGGGTLMQIAWGGKPGDLTRFGFWFCEFQASGRETIGSPSSLTAPQSLDSTGYLTLYGCDLLADIPFSPLGLGYPLDTISTFGMSIDQVHYCTFDNPWSYRHHIYEHSQGPVGDAYCTETDFTRCGGQVWQQTRRAVEGPDLTYGAVSAGTHYFINCTMKYFGRQYTWATAALTQYGSRRDIDMDGCVIVADSGGTQPPLSWPPADPYVNNLPGPYQDTLNSDLVQFSAEGSTTNNPHRSTAGHAAGSFRMRDCDVYIRNPRSGIVRMWHSTGVDIEDCSLLTSATSTDTRGVVLCFDTGISQDGAAPPAFPVLSFHIASCNTGARRTAFRAAHSEVPADALLTTTVKYQIPPPVVGARYTSATTAPWSGANCTQTINATNLQ